MSDLDNLMKKLKKSKPKEEKPVEEPEEKEVKETPDVPEDDEPEDDPEEDEDEEELVVPKPQTEKPFLRKVPKVDTKPSHEEIIGQEINLLQNNGVYRREKLALMKEQIDVLKVIAQTLIDLTGGEDGKENKK